MILLKQNKPSQSSAELHNDTAPQKSDLKSFQVVPKPPVTPKNFKKEFKQIVNIESQSSKSEKHDLPMIPPHTLKVSQMLENKTESNESVGKYNYNFDELDYHEEINTAQEQYSLKQHSDLVDPNSSATNKFKSKKMKELQNKYNHIEAKPINSDDVDEIFK